MTHSVETVKVKREDSASGFAIINKSDFKADVHELYVEPELEPQAGKEPDKDVNAGAETDNGDGGTATQKPAEGKSRSRRT